MFKKISCIGLLFMVMSAKAHQADVSTTMLVEKEDNSWVLQISASLTAFQHEIQTHFFDTPYQSPQEFQSMVLEHVKNNLRIRFNEKDIFFGKGIVQLGHETKVVFEVFGIPNDIKTVQIKNTAFQDIHKNQSALILLKEDFNKEHFVLNGANNHTLELYTEGNTFKILETERSNSKLFNLGCILGGIFMVVSTTILFSKMFKPEEIELRTIR
jgi:hypothetical protein